MTIVACPWKCGGVVNTAIADHCEECGRALTRTYFQRTNGDPEPRFGYDDPDRCTLRTGEVAGGTDSWGCHKIKGHATGRGGRHCSTHLGCGFRSESGTVCGWLAGHDDGIHEKPENEENSISNQGRKGK